MSVSDIVYLIAPAFLLASGLTMLFAPGRFRRDRQAYYDRKMAERRERGHDEYFEELRTLKAYRKPFGENSVRFFGALLAGISAMTIILRVTAR